MDSDAANELLTELFSAFETSDTQGAAILQFLKDKGMASDKELAPYLEQAGNASSVRWRATRVRINSLLASVAKKTEETLAKKAEEAAQKAVAAEHENEKSTRRRRKDTTEKGREEQVGKSKERTAGSRGIEQQARPDDGQRTKSAQEPKAEDEQGKPNVEDDGKRMRSEERQNDPGKDRGENETGKKIA